MSIALVRRFVAAFLVAILLISITASKSGAGSDHRDQSVFPTSWSSYENAEIGISIRYPSSWVIIPRSKTSGIGEPLTFSSQPSGQNQSSKSPTTPFKVEIGTYLVEWVGDKSIKDWTDEYNTAGAISGDNLILTESKVIRINRHLALRESGYSSLTQFRYVNVVRGNTIWFLWSNASTPDEAVVFDRIVRSFRFSRNAPTRLTGIYGDRFTPFQLPVQESMSVNSTDLQHNDTGDAFETNTIEPRIASSWRSPFNGTDTYNVRCDSAAPHQGHSSYAIDIPRPQGTLIVGAQTGNVSFIGWNNNGYGNLVKAVTGNHEAYYGHLQSFDWTTIQMFNPWRVTKSSGVGWVGSTGNSTGPHLHFHVRLTNNVTPVDLTGIQTFSPTAGLYPETGNPCGSIKYP